MRTKKLLAEMQVELRTNLSTQSLMLSSKLLELSERIDALELALKEVTSSREYLSRDVAIASQTLAERADTLAAETASHMALYSSWESQLGRVVRGMETLVTVVMGKAGSRKLFGAQRPAKKFSDKERQ